MNIQTHEWIKSYVKELIPDKSELHIRNQKNKSRLEIRQIFFSCSLRKNFALKKLDCAYSAFNKTLCTHSTIIKANYLSLENTGGRY